MFRESEELKRFCSQKTIQSKKKKKDSQYKNLHVTAFCQGSTVNDVIADIGHNG
jgi:hypothetical protein